jgi:hypothetical protein
MNEREVRIAKTEALFRDVNERIAETSERFDGDEAELMCECADPSCTERLQIPLDEYAEVREEPTRFVINAEHVEPDVERVVRHRRGYAVVEKFDAVVTRIVRQLDPRADPA